MSAIPAVGGDNRHGGEPPRRGCRAKGAAAHGRGSGGPLIIS